MNKKKSEIIVYIITKLELGGAQKVCLSLFNHFSTKTATWLISGTQGPLVETIKDKKNVTLLPSLKRSINILDLRAFYDIYLTLRTLKKNYQTVTVHTHSTKAGYLGRWAAWCAGIPKRIHTVHGFGFHPYQSKTGYAIAFLLEWITSFITTSYICVSSYDSMIGLKKIPFFAQKQSLIRAAINKDCFTPATQTSLKNKHHFTFGTISCFKKQKNIFDLLNAFYSVYQKNNTVRLEVIGDGVLTSDIKKWILDHTMQDVITLHGWQQDVTTIVHTWHAFVLSSLWEGLPCSLVEARSLKLPVICYNVGGISDLIQHNKNGLLYQPHDIQGLADGMYTLATNNKLYHSLANYQQDLTPYYTQTMYQQHAQLYSFK